ncbi:trigger factor [Fusibacter ferrireducens]|uniref:Trigger factor n=1 Tax=Fusibacter ferrireducens TaxID=2785058 RepID=A0ABR9ZZC2_9FIRM|nr:trigger factor [Fusibacter ferrireducens]MBF4695311.1 trigger factor [Fusibacter ferrireducens]
MSYEIVKKENSEITIQATVGKDEFEKAVKSAYNKNKGKFTVPGFRKGKVPQSIIEKQYGEGVFFEDAVNDLLQVHYEKALDALEITPVARPDIDVTEIGKGQDLVFTALVTVAPEFTLENYKGIEVEKINVDVTDEMLDTELEKTREMNARLISVTDRAVQDGDTVIMDYSGFLGEEQFEGGTAENQELVIGSGRFIPGFEEQLIGKALGSESEINVTFPEDYQAENLKGQSVVFKVKINEIKFKELPELDDEFAKDVSEFDTLAEYRESIKKELEESSKESAVAAQRDKVLEAVAGLLTVEIPEKMVDAEVDGMLREFDQQLRQQGLSLEQYVQFTGGNLDELKSNMREDALARVKTGLVIEKVMEQEAIEATDEDVEAELDKIAELQKRDKEEIRKLFAQDNFEYLKSNLKSRKTVDFLVDQAKLV